MKIKMTLDHQDVKNAIAAWVSQQTGLQCHADHVFKGAYSFDVPYVEIDTDVENALADEALPFVKEAA